MFCRKNAQAPETGVLASHLVTLRRRMGMNHSCVHQETVASLRDQTTANSSVGFDVEQNPHTDSFTYFLIRALRASLRPAGVIRGLALESEG